VLAVVCRTSWAFLQVTQLLAAPASSNGVLLMLRWLVCSRRAAQQRTTWLFGYLSPVCLLLCLYTSAWGFVLSMLYRGFFVVDCGRIDCVSFAAQSAPLKHCGRR
jgi:hypothetical protein